MTLDIGILICLALIASSLIFLSVYLIVITNKIKKIIQILESCGEIIQKAAKIKNAYAPIVSVLLTIAGIIKSKNKGGQ